MSAITEGLHYDLPNDEYHAQTDWLSSTQLKRALPEYTEPDNEEALRFGTLFHTVVLEPERLDKDYAVLDAAKVGVLKDGSPAEKPTTTKAWKDAVAEAERSGKTVIDQADWDKAHRMAESVRAHHDAARLLINGEGFYEESAFWTDDSGIQHKARFDRRIPGAVVDLKSTSTRLVGDKLAETTHSFLYHLSAAHYLEVAHGLDLDVNEFWFVFVSKAAPHHVQVCNLDDLFLSLGVAERARALDLIINGQRGISTLSPPRWARIPAGLAAIPSDFTWSPDDYS